MNELETIRAGGKRKCFWAWILRFAEKKGSNTIVSAFALAISFGALVVTSFYSYSSNTAVLETLRLTRLESYPSLTVRCSQFPQGHADYAYAATLTPIETSVSPISNRNIVTEPSLKHEPSPTTFQVSWGEWTSFSENQLTKSPSGSYVGFSIATCYFHNDGKLPAINVIFSLAYVGQADVKNPLILNWNDLLYRKFLISRIGPAEKATVWFQNDIPGQVLSIAITPSCYYELPGEMATHEPCSLPRVDILDAPTAPNLLQKPIILLPSRQR